MEDSINNIFSPELFYQFDWIDKNFSPVLTQAMNLFCTDTFEFKLIGVSKNINPLFQPDSYFVTKIKIDKLRELHVRTSEKAVEMILDAIFGEISGEFNLNRLTELEAKLITGLNDTLYNHIESLIVKNAENQKKNVDILNLTFLMKNKITDKSTKFLFAIPQIVLQDMPKITSEFEKFANNDFMNTRIEANIRVGSTNFTVKDLKTLEEEDIVLLEHSNIQIMGIIYEDYRNQFRITPNPALILPIDNDDEGDNMPDNDTNGTLWDNLQVEMCAEFDKIKIKLGELKNIEEGLVVDVSSIYDNKITLKVDEKEIARGELVIINDRYGVKIEKIFGKTKSDEQVNEEVSEENVYSEQSQEFEQEAQEDFVSDENTQAESSEDELDYSDFELDDEDI